MDITLKEREFIEYMCKKYNIDESHGIKHSIRTYYNLPADEISKDEFIIAKYCCLFHDLVDKKYNTDGAWKEINDFLPLTVEGKKVVHDIITTMSYSYLQKNPYPNHGKWQYVYEIVRHSDLMESFTVSRAYLYSKNNSNLTDDDIWEHVNNLFNLFNTRMFQYENDGWIRLPFYKNQLTELIYNAKVDLENKCKSYDF